MCLSRLTTPLPSTVVKKGEDNPQRDVVGQLLLSRGFTTGSDCTEMITLQTEEI